MKNVYQEGNSSEKKDNLSSGDFAFSGDAEKQKPEIRKNSTPGAQESADNASAPQMSQPQQFYQAPPPGYVQVPYGYVQQPPYGQPPPQGYYYAPPGPQIQLTQEQIAMLIQQYVIPQQFAQTQQQQFAQPQQVQNQPSQQNNDSGMRILYQSPDFDSHKDRKDKASFSFQNNVSDQQNVSVQEPVKQTQPEKEPSASHKLNIETKEHVIIEEETISIPKAGQKDDSQKQAKNNAFSGKGVFSVDDVEMSTFELDSIMLRKNPRARTSSRIDTDSEETLEHLRPQNVGYASASFNVEETFEETVEDVNLEDKKKTKKPKKKNSKPEIIRKTVLGISIVAIIVSSAFLVNDYRLSKENDRLEEEISNMIIDVEATTEEEPTEENQGKEEPEPEITEEPTTAPLTPEQQWAQIKKEYPNVMFPDFLQLKYAKLYATNQDFVGYLEAKGVGLSLPVVQSDDSDDEEYMEKNFYGKKTKYGCPFVTHLNNIINLDQNTIIFGHHMNNGTVFGALDEYKSIEGFKAAPVITFNTIYADYSWKVIAAFVTNAYPEQDNGYVFRYYFTTLSTQERFSAYLNEISQRSIYDTGVDVLPTDKLLTLSTCSHEFEDARFVVVARLVRNGESTEVDVSRATKNENPRYPQAYYDKKKLDNPFLNSSRWEVG